MSNYDRFKAFYQTASMWSGSLCGIQSFHLAQLHFPFNDTTAATLELPVIPAGTVLGKRAEYFFKFCIEQSTNYDLVVHNLQIFKGTTTLGELDYIVQERKTGKLLHIELVYKFYLYDPDHIEKNNTIPEPYQTELVKYIGPNRRDNFLYKLNRLKTHQLPLLYTNQAKDTLSLLGINVYKIQQQVCFLAHIFIPRALWQHDYKYINKKCISGYYVGYSAFAKAKTSNTYYLPEKFAWKMTPYDTQLPLNFEEVRNACEQSLERGYAPLVWMRLENGLFERFFVIKDTAF